MTKRKPKQTPTERARSTIAKLRVTLTYREIVSALDSYGLRTSISHLSRIAADADGREASEALAQALEAIA